MYRACIDLIIQKGFGFAGLKTRNLVIFYHFLTTHSRVGSKRQWKGHNQFEIFYGISGQNLLRTSANNETEKIKIKTSLFDCWEKLEIENTVENF